MHSIALTMSINKHKKDNRNEEKSMWQQGKELEKKPVITIICRTNIVNYLMFIIFGYTHSTGY